MKQILAICILICLVQITFANSGIYAGGPVYKNRNYSISELKGSGFTCVVVWTIHIDASGNLNFNAEFPLVQNGSYIGGSTYPNFAGDIASLAQDKQDLDEDGITGESLPLDLDSHNRVIGPSVDVGAFES